MDGHLWIIVVIYSAIGLIYLGVTLSRMTENEIEEYSDFAIAAGSFIVILWWPVDVLIGLGQWIGELTKRRER